VHSGEREPQDEPDPTPPEDQPIQGDDTEYVEKGLTDDDKESR